MDDIICVVGLRHVYGYLRWFLFANQLLLSVTIVPMSFFKGFTTLWRDSPKKFFYYYWAVLKQRIVDRIAMFQMSVQLRGGITKKFRRPDFKPTRKGVVEEALKLHAIMSHSVANGGKAERVQLAKICTPKLYRSLLAVIEARPAGKTYRWERVKLLRRLPFFPSWTRKPFWPRVVDFKWTEMPLGAGIDIKFRQAVVGIKSRQRLTQLNERGKPVGAPKEMELTEYLVLWRQVQNETQTLGPWLLSGTVQETGYEELKSEQDQIKLLSQLVTEQNLEENKKVAEAKGQKRTAGAS